MPNSKPAAFFDLDGTIIELLPESKHLTKWSQVKVIPAAVDLIKLFNLLDYFVIITTNKSAIGRGMITEAQQQELYRLLRRDLNEQGAKIGSIFHSPFRPEDNSECRKPGIGMLRKACQQYASPQIDMSRSVVIGDTDADEGMADNAGLKFIRVDNGQIVQTKKAVPRDIIWRVLD